MQWPDVVFDLPPQYRIGNPSSHISRDRLNARLTMPLWTDDNVPTLEGREVVIVLWDDDGRAIEYKSVIKRVSRN